MSLLEPSGRDSWEIDFHAPDGTERTFPAGTAKAIPFAISRLREEGYEPLRAWRIPDGDCTMPRESWGLDGRPLAKPNPQLTLGADHA